MSSALPPASPAAHAGDLDDFPLLSPGPHREAGGWQDGWRLVCVSLRAKTPLAAYKVLL
jgi:hypothetical protein